MINAKLYTTENVTRINLVKIGTAGLALVVCGYLIVTSATSVRDIWGADNALARERKASITLRREAADKRERDSLQPAPSSGGVETFALTFSQWASAAGARVESIVPEGAPVPSEITFGTEKLGTWNANKVRVQGSGAFASLTSLLDNLKAPGMPVQLESFSVETADPRAGSVNFDLVLTVYEKKNGTS